MYFLRLTDNYEGYWYNN